MENAGFFSSSLFWYVGEREKDHVCAGTSVCAGLRTPSVIIPQDLVFLRQGLSHGPAASLVSLLAGSELQGSTWLFLQKTGVTNRHHHSQIVQHGFWGPSSDKVSTFPARLLPSLLSVHLYMCVHRGVHTPWRAVLQSQAGSLTMQTLMLLECGWLFH